ncbi:alpha/beta fold hydrolase [Actinomadura alba]|uniref:Alpha/beta hydrolase n=1 Tax=Actinomadura alba TaxID=406431 RepID=A0ABR7LUH5_9ACTN|nr:alpha/beta hydrolase [Actinomadura alba]MBC6468500.1 alpha/beta hydrolase [Actinomadura alba]
MNRTRSIRNRALAAGLAAAALATAGVTTTRPSAASPGETRPAIGPAAEAGPEATRFHRQRIAWKACRQGPEDGLGEELDRAGAQCGEVTVPLDYSDPGGRTITVAMSRLKAADGAHRIGTMLLNGGGPGGGSMDLPPYVRSLMGDVGPRFDLIGMDPRSSGRSTAVDCGWPTGVWTRSAGLDRAGFDRMAAFERDLADRCARRHPDLLPHMTTRNIVRDMDVIRAALGERRISYYGASYGTYLGAVYTQMFPRRTDRFVLDSAVDPRRYGAEDMLADAAPANEAALRDWAAWAARRDGEYGLGATRRAVLATVERIIRVAARRPLRVGADLRVDEHMVPFLLFAALDDDRDEAAANLAANVRVLRDAAAGRPAEPTDGLRAALESLLTGADSRSGSSQAAILCGDRAVHRDPESYWTKIEAARSRQPVTGPLLNNISPCAFWPEPPREEPTRVRNDVPALIIAATGDTRTVYRHGLALRRLMTGSRLLTLRGARIHAVYPRYGNACVNDSVNAYLRDGALPATDLSCAKGSPTAVAG